MMRRPELLSPAGDMEKLKFAIHYGADAVYLAGVEFGMRSASANFTDEALADAIVYAHARGVRVYVTVNTMPRTAELPRMQAYLTFLEKAGADAVILSDLGVLSLVQRYAPGLEVHISTQASIVNAQSARMWHSLGAKRIVLARELALDEIAEIRAKTPDTLELEAFVHGSMCVSYSGRCLLSNYMTGRDANHGNCAQPCRWSYHLMEEKRPGEYYPVEEDARGTYIFNSKDMCMIRHIPELVRAGIDSFKIEGRVKTAYYAAIVTNAYRQAIDLYSSDPESFSLPDNIASEVDKVSHREYYTGFYFGGGAQGQYYPDSAYIRDWDVCAVVDSCDGEGNACLTQKNRFFLGERLELVEPGRAPCVFTVGEMKNELGETIDSAPHPHMKVMLRLPHAADPMAILRKDKRQDMQR